MYKVESGTFWNIIIDNVIVLEVTEEHYAKYLCEQLNNGTTLEEIKNRKYPDDEYFKYCVKQNPKIEALE